MVARRQIQLLRSVREFRLLFLASVASGLGTRLAVVALMVDVWDRTTSTKWVAALLVTDFVPMIVIAVLLGSVVDRFSRRGVMIASDLLRAAVFCALPFVGSAAAVVALAGVAGFATGFFRPASYAGLPNLVDDSDLAEANGTLQAADNVTWMVGPLLAGALLTVTTPAGAYWFNAATFVLSAVLIGRIAERLLQSRKAETAGYWRDLRAGFGLVRSPALLAVVVGWGLAAFAVGTTDVAEVELAKRAFESGNFGLGVLMAASGLGLIAGSLVAAEATTRFGTAAAYGVSIALMALGLVLAAVSPNVWVAAVVVVAVGLGNGVAVVINSLLVQRGTADELRGRAFTLAMSANYSAVLVGMIAGGFVADAVGARWTWGAGGAVLGCAAVIAYAYARGAGEAVAPAVVEPAPAPAASGAAAAGAVARHE